MILYEDNDACTAMGNAKKPTPPTRHIDIKYFSICEWIERDLMILECIDTMINMSDHFTKGPRQETSPNLGPSLLTAITSTCLYGHSPMSLCVHLVLVLLMPNLWLVVIWWQN